MDRESCTEWHGDHWHIVARAPCIIVVTSRPHVEYFAGVVSDPGARRRANRVIRKWNSGRSPFQPWDHSATIVERSELVHKDVYR